VWVEGRPPRVTITQGRWLRQPFARPHVGVIQRPVDVDVVNARALVLVCVRPRARFGSTTDQVQTAQLSTLSVQCV
jgi:hypothetical protein